MTSNGGFSSRAVTILTAQTFIVGVLFGIWLAGFLRLIGVFQ